MGFVPVNFIEGTVIVQTSDHLQTIGYNYNEDNVQFKFWMNVCVFSIMNNQLEVRCRKQIP